MIQLPSEREQKRVEEAIAVASDPTNQEPYQVALGLVSDGTDDLSPYMEKGEWYQTGIPIELDMTLNVDLPPRLMDAPVKLFAEVAGSLIPQVPGKKTMTIQGEDPYSRDLVAASAAGLAFGDDAVKLEEYTKFDSERAEVVARHAARKLPYNQSNVRIQPVPDVEIDWHEDGETKGLNAEEPVGEIWKRLSDSQTVGYKFRDTADDGLAGWVPEPLHTALRIPAGRKYDARAMPTWLKSRPTPPPLRYSAVRVYHTGRGGKVDYEWIEPVPYREEQRAVHKGRVKQIPFEDVSPKGIANARRRALREALIEARVFSTGETYLPCFDPLVEVHDPFQVTERHKNLDGIFELLWAMRIEAYKHVYGEGTGDEEVGLIGTLVQYTATLLVEDRIKVPTLIVPRTTRIQPKTPPEAYGVDGDSIYFNDTATGVAAQGEDLIFYDNGPATVEGDDIVVRR